ncbi:hypothetical protein BDV25DRAFT_6513 [Aspergillus avenaceus]|uniref:Uncharacterized protein n=1 Tax=Aspergillus avenaceus TaxID=36643 RepID=A0A5N6TS50_ASPAV|nr:hypothetical protein BDV25DRAFT_6513 [Aspergillus avenaceus]
MQVVSTRNAILPKNENEKLIESVKKVKKQKERFIPGKFTPKERNRKGNKPPQESHIYPGGTL